LCFSCVTVFPDLRIRPTFRRSLKNAVDSHPTTSSYDAGLGSW
jgi:hypothetical protein